MKLTQIRNHIDACISAFECASTGRKLVRQVDTGIRKLEMMSPKTRNRYDQFVKETGHYSKNPVKRLISYVKSWNIHRKNLKDCYDKLYL